MLSSWKQYLTGNLPAFQVTTVATFASLFFHPAHWTFWNQKLTFLSTWYSWTHLVLISVAVDSITTGQLVCSQLTLQSSPHASQVICDWITLLCFVCKLKPTSLKLLNFNVKFIRKCKLLQICHTCCKNRMLLKFGECWWNLFNQTVLSQTTSSRLCVSFKLSVEQTASAQLLKECVHMHPNVVGMMGSQKALVKTWVHSDLDSELCTRDWIVEVETRRAQP